MARIILGLCIALGATASCGGDGSETIDAGVNDSDAMIPAGECGNGAVEAGETCDDGNQSDGDACPATCAEVVCGDGVIAPGELCLPYARPFASVSLFPVAAGDFNGDGNLDVAGVNGESMVFVNGDGEGAGTEGAEISLADLSVRGVAPGDVDGDDLDEVVFVGTRTVTDEMGVETEEDGVGIISADATEVAFSATSDASSLIATGDFNGDGLDDVVTAGPAEPSRAYILGLSPTEVADADDADAIAVADVTGDSADELVIASGEVIKIFEYQDGALVQAHAADKGFAPTVTAIRAGDVDGNGTIDLVLYGNGAAAVLAQSDAGFPAAADPAAQIAPVPGASILLLDIEGDGDLDLVAAGGSSREVVALINHEGQLSSERLGSLPLALVVAGDFDSDGLADLVGIHGGGLAISATGTRGKLLFPDRFSLPSDAYAVAVGDVTGDEIVDMVVTTHDPEAEPASSMVVIPGRGGGDFDALEVLAGGTCEWPFDVALVDVDQSGVTDIVAGCRSDGHLAVYLAADDGWERQPDIALESSLWAMAAGDINDDGRDDVVVSHHGNDKVSVLLGDGDELRLTANLDVPGQPTALALGDVDGDGDLDLVIGQRDADAVIIFKNATGRADFVDGSSYAVGRAPVNVAMADLDNNGALDMVVVNNGDGETAASVTSLFNAGSGELGELVSYEDAASPFGIAIADLDSEGPPEIVVAAGGDDAIHLMDTATVRQFAVENQPHTLAIADVNGDGAPDIVAAHEGGSSITIGLSDP